MRARIVSLPGPVWTMLLWAVGSLLNAVALGLWFSGEMPDSRAWLLQCTFEIVVIVLLLVLAQRTPVWLLHVILLMQIWSIAALSVLRGDPVSVATWWIGGIGAVLYASYWWHGWVSYAYVAIVSGGLLVVIGITGTGAYLGMAWVIITSMSLALALGLNTLVGKLETQARHDTLTGLLSRAGLDDYFELHPRAGRAELPRSLVVIDIDGFKAVNDERGHESGDQLLKSLAQAWSGALRPDDLAVRTGGDEFVLLLPQTGVEGALALVRRMHAADPTPWSCGIVDWRADESFDSALRRADLRMYEDKARRSRRLA